MEKQIPILKLNIKENLCGICFCKCISITSCNHSFHEKCLVDWFKTCKNTKCPVCRQVVKTKKVISKERFDIFE